MRPALSLWIARHFDRFWSLGFINSSLRGFEHCGVSAALKKLNGEPTVRIQPGLGTPQANRVKERIENLEGVLVGVLGDNGFSSIEEDALSTNPDFLRR